MKKLLLTILLNVLLLLPVVGWGGVHGCNRCGEWTSSETLGLQIRASERSIAKISAIPRSFQELRAVVNNLPTNAPESILRAWNEVLGVRVDNWFDLSTFKSIVAKTPGIDNASLTNLPKSFWDEAFKFLPDNSSPFKSQIDNIVVNGDPSGKLTETLVEDIMKANGYNVGNGRYYGEYETARNGIDGFFYKGDISNPTEIIVIDSKQMSSSGSVTLNAGNEATGLPIQMKESWIDYIAREKLTNLNDPIQMSTKAAILNAPQGFIQKYVAAVDKTTGELKFLKLGETF